MVCVFRFSRICTICPATSLNYRRWDISSKEEVINEVLRTHTGHFVLFRDISVTRVFLNYSELFTVNVIFWRRAVQPLLDYSRCGLNRPSGSRNL